MYELVIKEEKNEERKQMILTELEKLFNGMQPSLDAKAREGFNSKFTAFKTFLFDLNQKAWYWNRN